jgi:hypothetical protein
VNALERAFQEFDEENPRVYELLCRFADEAISVGRTRLGISLLFERIRWEVYIITSDDEFKLNNNHRAYYARRWLSEHPQYPEFFATRKVKGEEYGFGFDDDGQGVFF